VEIRFVKENTQATIEMTIDAVIANFSYIDLKRISFLAGMDGV
jgi:hypothetical protein